MSKRTTYLHAVASLDGYIADDNDDVGNPGGDDFIRLHEWYGFKGTPPNTEGTGRSAYFMDEGNATGAVLLGGAPWGALRPANPGRRMG